MSYPRNAASPERLAIGAVSLIADGTVQTSAVVITVRGQGGAEGTGGGTTVYGASGIVYYTPTQAETDFTSFAVIASKASCTPVAVTIITSASVTPGTVLLAPVTHTSAVVPTVTTLTNLPSIPANWLTAAGVAAAALNGKGDWNVGKSGYALTATTGLGNQTANIAGSVTSVSGSVGSVTGAVGSVTGLTAANLDATISSRMATYTQPTGFLAATFPTGTIANTTNITAGSVASVTGAVGSVTGAVGSVTGAVGSVTGNIGGNVVGSVASVSGAVGSLTTNNDKTGYALSATGSAALTEAYAADNVAPTLSQMLYMIWSLLSERNASGTTLTTKRIDGSTTAMTFTLDAASPSTQTRTT